MKPYYEQNGITIYNGDCHNVLAELASGSANCAVTSPPYFGLRDYGVAEQIGSEQTPEAYVAEMVAVFREVRRVLRDDGTLWLNLGDSYAGSGKGGNPGDSPYIKQKSNNGSLGVRNRIQQTPGLKPKDLIGIPWMVAFALRADGWYLRSDIIWHKPNPMPESVTDRPTRAHEYIFLLSKSGRYHYDGDAIAEVASYDGPPKPGQRAQSVVVGHNKVHTGSLGSSRRSDKQRGHSRRHDGFNDRWDSMERSEQCVGMRNKRDVWTVAPSQFRQAHFATFPPKLIEPCVKAGCPTGGVVLDPFFGAGTTGLVSQQQNVRCIGIELNPDYCKIAANRLSQGVLEFASSAESPSTYREGEKSA